MLADESFFEGKPFAQVIFNPANLYVHQQEPQRQKKRQKRGLIFREFVQRVCTYDAFPRGASYGQTSKRINEPDLLN